MLRNTNYRWGSLAIGTSRIRQSKDSSYPQWTYFTTPNDPTQSGNPRIVIGITTATATFPFGVGEMHGGWSIGPFGDIVLVGTAGSGVTDGCVLNVEQNNTCFNLGGGRTSYAGYAFNMWNSAGAFSGTTNEFSASTAVVQGLIGMSMTVNQSGTAGYRALRLTVTETTTGSGDKSLIDLGTNTDLTTDAKANSGAYGDTHHTTKFKVSSAGKITSAGTAINIATQTPASAAAAGTTGDIAWDTSFIYVCTATNTWKRAAISTW